MSLPLAESLPIKPRKAGHPLWPWYAAETIHSFGTTIFLWCVPYYAKNHLGGTDQQNLLLMAGWGFTYIAFALISGRLVDRWGSRRLIVRMSVACIFTALASLLTLLYPNLWLLFFTMTAFNFTSTNIWPAMESAISRSPGSLRLDTRMGIYNLTWSAGGFVAAFFAAAVLSIGPTAGPVIAFTLPAACSLIALILVAGFAPPQSALTGEHLAEPEADDSTHHKSPALLYIAWIGNTMGYVCCNVMIAVMPKLTEHHPSAVGSTWKLATVVGFLLFWKWRFWHYRRGWMFMLYAVMAASFFVMLAWPSLPVLVVTQIVFGLCAAFLYTSALYYAMHISSGGGSHAGTHEALIGLGIGVGSAAGALALTWGSGAPLLPVAAAVSVVLLGGAAAMARVASRRPTPKLSP
jgi:predicted MFS family arabinose efflux permease